MPPKVGKRKVFCGIGDYVNLKDPTFWDTVGQVCMTKYFIPSKREVGIAFIYPSDAVRKDIIEKSLDQSTVEESINLIQSYLMPENLPTVEELVSKVNVGNKLKVAFTVDKKQSKGNVVVFEEGFSIEKDPEFVPIPRHGNISVWTIKSGVPPLTGKQYNAPVKKRVFSAGGVEGGAEIDETALQRTKRLNTIGKRLQLAMQVESKYLNNKDSSFDPYLDKVVSLLLYMKKHHYAEYIAIHPLLDSDPIVTFYLLLQPYRNILLKDGWFIPTEILFDDDATAWNGISAYRDAKADYITILREKLDVKVPITSGGAQVETQVLFYSSTNDIMVEVDKIRVGFSNVFPNTPSLLCSEAEKIFKENLFTMDAKHRPYLPPTTLKLLDNAETLLWVCEFRHIVRAIVAGIGTEFSFNDLISHVRDVQPSDNYHTERFYTQYDYCLSSIVMEQRIRATREFMYSTDFLFVTSSTDSSAFVSQVTPDDDMVTHPAEDRFAKLENSSLVMKSESLIPREISLIQARIADLPA